MMCNQCRLQSHISFLQRWSTHMSSSSGVCCYLLPNLGHHFPKAENNYDKKKPHTPILCLVQLLHECHSKPPQKRLQECKEAFCLFCHRVEALLSSFKAQCRETAWKCESAPSRAVTELYLLFNSYVVFTSRAAWLAAAAHALRTVKHSQVPVSTTAFWKFTSIVPSFMFHLNYPFTDVWLKQLFENAVSTTTDRVNSILLWCAGNQKAFKYSFVTNDNSSNWV